MNISPLSLRSQIGLFGRGGEQRIAKALNTLEPFPTPLEAFRDTPVKAEFPVEVTT